MIWIAAAIVLFALALVWPELFVLLVKIGLWVFAGWAFLVILAIAKANGY
jgi:hypothetical protein